MLTKRKDNQPAASAQLQAAKRVAPSMPAGQVADVGKAATMIGPTVVINGKLSGDEDIVIAGTIEGEVSLPGNAVTIAKGGHAYADFNANVVEVRGEVRGNINGNEKVVIADTGRMVGNIVAKRMVLEDGALFKGSIDIEGADRAMAPAKAAPQKQDAGAAAKAGDARKAADQQANPVAVGAAHARRG